MFKWERIVNDILLENSYDLTMFSSKDISSFSESCSKVKLNETEEFDEEYYENPSEFEAHKRAFIMAAEQLLYKNIDYSNVETDLKKIT